MSRRTSNCIEWRECVRAIRVIFLYTPTNSSDFNAKKKWKKKSSKQTVWFPELVKLIVSLIATAAASSCVLHFSANLLCAIVLKTGNGMQVLYYQAFITLYLGICQFKFQLAQVHFTEYTFIWYTHQKISFFSVSLKLHHLTWSLCVFVCVLDIVFNIFRGFRFSYLAHHFHFIIDTVCDTSIIFLCFRFCAIEAFHNSLSVRTPSIYKGIWKETRTNNLKTSNERYAPWTLYVQMHLLQSCYSWA